MSVFKISLLITLFFIVLCIISPIFLETIEKKTLDFKFRSRGVRTPAGQEVVIVAVDEKSVGELGRWPWPRARIAELVNHLNEYGTRVVAFDIIFAEPQRNTELEVLKQLRREFTGPEPGEGAETAPALRRNAPELKFIEKRIGLAQGSDDDRLLASAVKKFPGMVMGYFFYFNSAEIANLGEKDYLGNLKWISNSEVGAIRAPAGVDPSRFLRRALGVQVNIPVISEAAHTNGFFNAIPDDDGTIRGAMLVLTLGDRVFPSLALQSVSLYLNAPIMMGFAEYGVEQIAVGDKSIPVDESGKMMVNFYGPGHTFPHYSASDVVTGKLDPALFKDKIVLVGATAIGIYDIRATPFSAVFPGVEVHANIIENILHGDFLIQPSWIKVFDLVSILIIGLLLGLILPRVRAAYGLIPVVAIALSYYGIDRYLFEIKGVIVSTVYPIAEIFFIFLGITFYKYLTEEKKRKQYREAFSRYVSASVVNEILKDPDRLKLGGERRTLTVMFTDIRGFTSISEKLDPETVVHILNEYLTPMTEVVFQQGGMLDKYIGDAIMAVWGAPLTLPDHARRACITALEMMKRLKVLQQGWEERKLPPINIGIGVNTGPMSVGNMGSEMLFDYTVIGDSVNLASRLEGLNKEYGTNIIVSEGTYQETKDEFVFRVMDRVVVKGKKETVGIFELLGNKEDAAQFSERVARFEAGFKAYQNRQWQEAIREFEALGKYEEDKAARIFIERCRLYQESPPPPDWNGAFVLTKK
ncbi:MAG: adenylate/guanylate cyclase domain-containing protein [bacterium]|nr:adenylate/guanylate cyclase domain-containing protein [bacterium]